MKKVCKYSFLFILIVSHFTELNFLEDEMFPVENKLKFDLSLPPKKKFGRRNLNKKSQGEIFF